MSDYKELEKDVDGASRPSRCSASVTVAGVTFTAEQVVSAVVKIDGREIHIQKPDAPPKSIGFSKT